MPTCTRRLTFCAGHRVLGHESKCAHLHGHNYTVFFTASAELDSIGRVIDFSVLKQRIGGWLEEYWDHGFIYHQDDMVSHAAVQIREQIEGCKQKSFILADNPTAENLAEYLLRVVCPSVLVGTDVQVTKVVIWETENCLAEANL